MQILTSNFVILGNETAIAASDNEYDLNGDSPTFDLSESDQDQDEDLEMENEVR